MWEAVELRNMVAGEGKEAGGIVRGREAEKMEEEVIKWDFGFGEGHAQEGLVRPFLETWLSIDFLGRRIV